ncbi:hypothetical protein SRHO_G00138770 [Serrasalmus rhombeus]
MYKNPSTPDFQVKCNLTSDNMLKIHPQTKVLIIKTLKTKSAAEVAEIFNVSKCQVERIRKRFQETGDVHDKHSRRPVGTCMDPKFTQKTVKFGGGKIMVWGYIQYGGVRVLCRMDGNINSLKYQDILAAH